MDLQISVFFLFLFFTAGQSLLCYQCLKKYCLDQLVICSNGGTKCKSSTSTTQFGFLSFKDKVKGCSTECHSGSLNLGFTKMSTTCCDTSFCNNNDAPDPRTFTPNGKKCYYCDGKGCSNTLSCLGSEDRCLTATETWKTQPAVVKGCISKSLCNYELHEWDLSCCEGDFCNGESSVIQSVTQSSMHDTNGFIQNVTHSFNYKSDKQNFMYNRAKRFSVNRYNNAWSNRKSSNYNNVKSQRFKYNNANSAKQSSTYNRAKSVTQSFLFLCFSLISFILMY